MASDSSSPTGTENRGTPKTQGWSSAPAPVIDLPHRWDESGKLLPGTSPSPCSTCDWNGVPESFWDHDRYKLIIGEDLMRECINCASCKLFRSILFKRAELEGKEVTRTSSVAGPGFHVDTQFDDESEYISHSIFVSSDTPESEIDRYNISRRFISSGESLNQEASKWAQELLAVCEGSHELCRPQSGEPFLPTRLINLQRGWNGLDVRLESSSSVLPGSSYVALSYCWGSHRPACITTAETLAQNQMGIPWDKLPATFQDAAAFTLSLGIQYLWIDSICIIQEDEEDWQREADKMYAVYKSSYLTLVALSGSSSNYGLRAISMKQDSHLLAELRITQNVYPLYIRRGHFLDSLEVYDVVEFFKRKSQGFCYPLLGRAWAYQERIVSPRVMFFTESEMIFQCLEDGECECGSVREWRRTNVVEPSRKTTIFLQTESDSLRMKGKDLVPAPPMDHIRAVDRQAWQIAQDWRSVVVTEYSNLDISMPRDRLPALAAIAEQFQRVRTGEVYLAGLWSRSLLDDLLWVCDAGDRSLRKSKAELERPFSLPTWSWASLQCRAYTLISDVSVPMADILEANCSYVGEYRFGVLQSSRLVLRGRILETILKWTGDESFTCSFWIREGDTWAEYPDGPFNQSNYLRIRMDMDHDGAQRIPQCQEIHVMEISESTADDGDEWHFLLLRKEDKDGFIFTRAGAATLEGPRLGDEKDEYEEREDDFERTFQARSVLTTCEIR